MATRPVTVDPKPEAWMFLYFFGVKAASEGAESRPADFPECSLGLDPK